MIGKNTLHEGIIHIHDYGSHFIHHTCCGINRIVQSKCIYTGPVIGVIIAHTHAVLAPHQNTVRIIFFISRFKLGVCHTGISLIVILAVFFPDYRRKVQIVLYIEHIGELCIHVCRHTVRKSVRRCGTILLYGVIDDQRHREIPVLLQCFRII